MPTIWRESGFRFYFFANEGDPREPVHVHISKAGCEAKIWLRPQIAIAYNDGFSAIDMRALVFLVAQNRGRIEGAWNAFFRS